MEGITFKIKTEMAKPAQFLLMILFNINYRHPVHIRHTITKNVHLLDTSKLKIKFLSRSKT